MVISTHAPLAGRDCSPCRSPGTRPRISTHAPLAGRDDISFKYPILYGISTHAPLAGRDGAYASIRRAKTYFNPRAPCGARPPAMTSPTSDWSFQPTRPLRGATRPGRPRLRPPRYFNPRAPCGARRLPDITHIEVDNFNPRAPCGARPRRSSASPPGESNFNPRAPCGARLIASLARNATYEFQPTRPLRGATGARPDLPGGRYISTHAPLAGRDREAVASREYQKISTHAPLAGRDVWEATGDHNDIQFQPTRPLRGATVVGQLLRVSVFLISTHAPLAGRDYNGTKRLLPSQHFNPRAPCGARPWGLVMS